jgi:hypothetical protein
MRQNTKWGVIVPHITLLMVFGLWYADGIPKAGSIHSSWRLSCSTASVHLGEWQNK